MSTSFLLSLAYFWVQIRLDLRSCMHVKELNYIIRHTYQATVYHSVGRSGLFDRPVDYNACRAWLNSTRLHFPTTWISSIGLSPWHSRHQWSFINASHRPFKLSSLPVIGEMSSTNVNISWLCESGFLQGARKWMKTSEPIMFCYSPPFKCSSLNFLNQTEAGEVDSRLDWMSEWSSWGSLVYSYTNLFFLLFGWVNVIVLDIMSCFLTQII